MIENALAILCVVIVFCIGFAFAYCPLSMYIKILKDEIKEVHNEKFGDCFPNLANKKGAKK